MWSYILKFYYARKLCNNLDLGVEKELVTIIWTDSQNFLHRTTTLAEMLSYTCFWLFINVDFTYAMVFCQILVVCTIIAYSP